MLKPMIRTIVFFAAGVFGLVSLLSPDPKIRGAAEDLPIRQMEALGRGLVAINLGEGKIFVSWRLLGTDPEDIAFNLYRRSGDETGGVPSCQYSRSNLMTIWLKPILSSVLSLWQLM